MIAILDYDAGNLRSVEKALNYIGEDTVITRDKDVIMNSDKVILPGVGSFGDAMEKLNNYNLINTIYDVVDKKIPFLGICLGLQLLFEESEETPGVTGLGILKGRIKKIPSIDNIKIPHMGWNSIDIKDGAKLFRGMSKQEYVYFVHSYYLEAEDENIVAATTEYGTHIHASVESGNIFACQFHPEKSSETGLHILQNFVNL
ncbi:imidazole glycerol phosphate synthase subunit HisH [Falcatimonas sp. MSJ-15]|uniref:imidazole glycerol phosphate synthase subunit HisH n=1 Tax=Falcatimonas sp. MSJ-15 TaxID=2841515 RepID=UPI001C10ABA4|nr:imidazole glycerol phosphate synthase subunit HisH [Falcatimonas sp. MSJ-15]MBU5471396.1 imidazole glycerol phosphate synthase subunit HisH [Falcatimonas sp. MSJ-15]